MKENIIIIAILLFVLGGALAYIIKSKRNGAKCIGCPYSKNCNKNCTCSGDNQ